LGAIWQDQHQNQRKTFWELSMQNEQLIKMLNPTKYVGCEGTAKHWRIRHGAFDRDTSLAIPVILATRV
jgi:hypothetical protein